MKKSNFAAMGLGTVRGEFLIPGMGMVLISATKEIRE